MTEQAMVFDIETIRNEQHMRFCPPFDMPLEFDQSQVKLGNLKDPEKIAKKLLEAELGWPAFRAKAEAAHIGAFKSMCSLSALTGKIACISYAIDGASWVEIDGSSIDPDDVAAKRDIIEEDFPSETALLKSFWEQWNKYEWMIGFASKGFDLPFIIQRSWINKIPIGINPVEKDNPKHIDLMNVWRQWAWRPKESDETRVKENLENICAVFGIEGKLKGENNESIGSNYDYYWNNKFGDAVEYAYQDIIMTKKLAEILVPRL